MPRIDGEDAFMASLLAGLDADIFTSPPSSSQSISRPPSQQERTRGYDKRVLPASPGRSVHPTPRKRVACPRPPNPSDVLRDERFWDNPLAKPSLSPAALAKRDQIERTGGYAPGTNSVCTKLRRATAKTVEGTEPRRVKRVEIALNDKENSGQSSKMPEEHTGLRDPGGLGAPAVTETRRLRAAGPASIRSNLGAQSLSVPDDFDELLGGVDWNEALLGHENEQAVEPMAAVPRCKRYARCMVEEVTESQISSDRPQKMITVTSSAFEGPRQVLMYDDWVHTPVDAGDVVNLIDLPGLSDTSEGAPLELTRSKGLLVLHPDILVSSTKVADSSHCTRKAVLQELIRTTGQSSPSLLYGNMLHALMQNCMVDGRWDDIYRFERIDDIIKDYGATLWELELPLDKVRLELLERSREFEAFARRFTGSRPKADAFLSDPRVLDSERTRLAIDTILGVEDDIWSPRFGLKGKIDVSTASSVLDSVGFTHRGTMPFEIKTGRTIAGMEHRAQTMLYTLLMTDRYDQDIDSGLLYYTQTNEVFRVQAARNEIRGLILARNDFATFLHRRMTLSSKGLTQHSAIESPTSLPQTPDDDDEEADLWKEFDLPLPYSDAPDGEPALLPPPIDDERSCGKCYARDACMLFRRAVDCDERISANADDPLQLLFDDMTGHLTSEHTSFFRRWERLISFEEQELVRYKKEIWTLTAHERETVGRCFADMVVVEGTADAGTTVKSVHRFAYRLRRQAPPDAQPHTLLGGFISVNDPIVLSQEDPSLLAISRGFVLSLTPHEVVVGVDRPLLDTPLPRAPGVAERVFRIDKDELAAGMGRIRDNLIQLFVPGGDERRRRQVVDLEPPAFTATVGVRGEHFLAPSLNTDQLRAIEKVLAAQDYALILGMPGTGKTTTIAEVIRALARAGKSVLLTSYTHSAVDNILLKIKDDGLKILRLGNRDKILPALHDLTLSHEDYAMPLASINDKLMTPQIVATTCLGINESIFVKRRFDVCIVDEASQVTLPTCLGPLRFADSFVLVGDHNQLPPLVRNDAARKGGLDVSLFKRLSDAHPAAVVSLTHQYRMNEDIMLLPNKLIYSDQLRIGADAVGNRKLKLPQPAKAAELEPWLREVVDPLRSVVFIDTDALPARERRNGSLIDNKVEASLVQQAITGLSACGAAPADIGVITLYRQQIKLLSRLLEPSFPDVEVLTADRSQGRDKECILVSLVRSNPGGHVGDLVKDWRRINVVLTRAKAKLVLFGSRSTLAHNPLMRQLLDIVEERSWVYKLPPNLDLPPHQQSGTAMDKCVQGESEDVKPLRRGPGSLALRKPLAMDVINSL